jgi:RNA polymerase sigma-70 factor (ECF subfamily)
LQESDDQAPAKPVRGHSFPDTRWSLVLRAGSSDSGRQQREALESLCVNYWLPVYGYIRRQGNSPENAQDLTQDFFLHVLGGTFLTRANPERGRFRSFMLGALKNYLSDSRDRERAVKRGGATEFLPLDFESGEASLQREPSHSDTPERVFQRRWARAVLDAALARLRQEFVQQGKAGLFDSLKVHLSSSSLPGAANAADELGLTESAVKSALYRMRRRYRDVLREEVAATVDDFDGVDEELRFLLQAASSRAELA